MKKFSLLFLLLLLVSCPSSKTQKNTSFVPSSNGMLKGVFHRVEEGETLSQLSINYNVSLEDILEINDLNPNDIVYVDDEIFIPNASRIIHKKIVHKKNKKKNKIKIVRKQVEIKGLNKNSLPWPVDGVLISKFSKNKKYYNDGIDIAIRNSTPIKLVLDGEIIFSGYQKGYGNIVIAQHKNKIITIYAHNKKNLVKTGQKLKRGHSIALVGSSGNSKRSKLHFEIRKGVKALDPLIYLKD